MSAMSPLCDDDFCGQEEEAESDSVLELINRDCEEPGYRYGPLPPQDASIYEWQSAFPISELPEIPPPKAGYYSEPFIGISTVAIFCGMFVTCTIFLAAQIRLAQKRLAAILMTCIITWACIAFGCLAYLLLGKPNVIARSSETCYPIPEEVTTRLLNDEDLDGLKNVKGSDGRTYCARCLVWRPQYRVAGRSHHCNTCQHCVTHFDHHCGVFGRCIVRGNLPCFYTVISMLFFAVVTLAITAAVSGDVEAEAAEANQRMYNNGTIR